MKITKILVALSFLFSVATANAGELTVTGSMEATYHTEGGQQTGNPLGTDRELKFSGSCVLEALILAHGPRTNTRMSHPPTWYSPYAQEALAPIPLVAPDYCCRPCLSRGG